MVSRALRMPILSLTKMKLTGQTLPDDLFMDIGVQSMTVASLQSFIAETAFYGELVSKHH